MKKLILAIEDLRVETFDPGAADGNGRGTVVGRQPYPTFYAGWPCDLPTNSPLDYRCADSVHDLPDQPGNCTNVCHSGPLICDTGVEQCP